MVINTKFDIGDILYLKTDEEQLKRMIVGVNVRPNGVVYLLNCGSIESYHYEIELSREIDVLMTITNQ